jgi:Mrp family chromosome partitioning ATPase
MLHRHFRQPNNSGLVHWFDSGANLDGKLDENPHLGLAKVGENFWVLPSGGHSKSPTRIFENPAFGRLLEKLKEQFDLVVIDSPPMGVVADPVLIAERADEILYVCRFNLACRRYIKLHIRTFLNRKDAVLGIVLNRLSARRIAQYSDYRSYKQRILGALSKPYGAETKRTA